MYLTQMESKSDIFVFDTEGSVQTILIVAETLFIVTVLMTHGKVSLMTKNENST